MAKAIPATPSIPAAMPPIKAPVDTAGVGAAEEVLELITLVAVRVLL
jgi:hypothetical protein